MKYILIYSTGIALAGVLIFGCRKDSTEQPIPPDGITPDETLPSAAVVSRMETYGCGDYIQGEPTYVEGVYDYPPIALFFETTCPEGVAEATIYFDALTIQYRFKIADQSGYVLFDSGWISGTGWYQNCFPANCQLLVSARSSQYALDRWNVSISECLCCS